MTGTGRPLGLCDDGRVTDRLDALDASFLYLEDQATPMHVASVMVFEPTGDGFDHERLIDLVSSRIGEVTRYRQRVREMPGRLGPPLWIDDVDFDITYHVRRSALPRPGTRAQLAEFTARVVSRPLDRARPLWELYLVEGLEDGRFAVVTKVHQALVDGVNAVDIAHLVLDDTPDAELDVEAEPLPTRPEPGDLDLVAGALWDLVSHPSHARDLFARGRRDLREAGRSLVSGAGGVLGALASTATNPAPASPLNTRVGAARRIHMSALPLERFRGVRDAVAALPDAPDVSVHDVVLTALAGGLGAWLAGRGEPVHAGTVVRALVPVGTSDRDEAIADGGSGGRVGLVDRVVGCVVDLPVGEPDALIRLERIAFGTGRAGGVGAATMAGVAGFAPSTLHHLGARMGQAATRRRFNLVVTNVPGPQEARFLPGARLLETYPVLPLGSHHALGVGLTSYDGAVCLGLVADRASIDDVDLLGECVAEGLTDLDDRLRSDRPSGRVTPPRRNRP